MKTTFSLCPLALCMGISLLAYPADAALAQGAAPQPVNAASALAQLSTAFSGPHVVHSVQLSGTAGWYAGSLEDSGTASLTASSDGSAQMQLALDATGQVTETQTGTGLGAQCQWSGADGVSHAVDAGNCLRSALWFLPALSLQPSALSSQQVFADLGMGTVGSGETVYHHLQGQIVPSGSAPSSQVLSELIQRTTTDIGLDPASSLPAVLAYSVHPNNGAQLSIAIEIHYSDYQAVSGVQVPFHIQRYVNGALQLDILVSSATVN